MGRWLDALKKHENADEGHPQNPQKDTGGDDGISGAAFSDAAQECGEVATGRDGPDAGVPVGNAKATAAEIAPPMSTFDSSRVPSPAVVCLGERPTPTAHPNLFRAIMERLEGDMEAYAGVLRTHGPMSYGQAMHVLGWGGTRAGQAESDLRAAGRIAFNQLGRAYLVDEEANHGE